MNEAKQAMTSVQNTEQIIRVACCYDAFLSLLHANKHRYGLMDDQKYNKKHKWLRQTIERSLTIHFVV